MVAPSLTETLAEMLLAGAVDLDEGFDGISDVLSTIRDLAVPDAEADFTYLIDGAVQESRLTPVARYATEHAQPSQDRYMRLAQRVALAVAASVVLVTMSGGMAYAANGAKPGDLLYGLDRTLEAIGIGDGGTEERLAETAALIASGIDPIDLLDASDVLTSPPPSGLEQNAPSSDSDDPGDSPPRPESSEKPPQEGHFADNPGEDSDSLDEGNDPTASISSEQTTQPSPDETDEPATTDDKASGDSTDPAQELPEQPPASETPGTPEPPGTSDTPEPPGTPETPETPGTSETLREVIAELQGIVANHPGSPLADKVEDAKAKADTALEELEKTPPDNQAAAGNIEGAIGDIEAAIADGLLDPGHGNRLVDQLAEIVRQL